MFFMDSPADMAKVIPALEQSDIPLFGLDIETARLAGYEEYVSPVNTLNKPIGPQPGLDPHLSSVRLLQLYAGKHVYVFDIWKSGAGLEPFRKLLTTKNFVAHNGIFEIKHISHAGIPGINCGCSMLLAMLTDYAERSPFEKKDKDILHPLVEDEEDQDDDAKPDGLGSYRHSFSFGLDKVVERLFRIRVSKTNQTSNWNAFILTQDQLAYAGLDAVLTYRVAKHFLPLVNKLGMGKVYTLLRDMQHVVAEMETTGFKLDLSKHKKLIKEWEDERRNAERDTGRFFGGVNLNSSKQKAEWLEKRYKARPEVLRNWPRTDPSERAPISRDNPRGGTYTFNRVKIAAYYKDEAIAAYLRFKKVDKLLNTYGEGLAKAVHPITGKLHSSFTLGETRTGRLSSRAPNIQNGPRDEKFRRCFVAEAERTFILADFNQIEVRVQAELSRDPVMLDTYIKGLDIYKRMAAKVLSKKIEAVTEDERNKIGKLLILALGYGMGPRKLGEYAQIQFGLELPEATRKRYWQEYHDLFKVYSQWCNRVRLNAENIGWVRTPTGKVRKLVEDEVYTRGPNTIIQGGASEIMEKSAILVMERRPKASSIKLVNCIHDELILSAHPEEAPEARKLLGQCMVDGMLWVLPKACVNKLADATVGDNWWTAKKGEKKLQAKAA